jgi:hypothetical protein
MKASEEWVAFYFEIGRALTQWAVIEHRLLDVAHACLPSAGYRTLMFGFYAIENFRSKLAFVDKLLHAKHGDNPLIQRWPKLSARCMSVASKRNALAHRSAAGFHQVPFDQQTDGRSMALVEWSVYQEAAARPEFDTKPPPGSICLQDVTRIRMEITGLEVALFNFQSALLRKPVRFPESLEQPPRPPTIRELEDQIREAFGLPPKPSRKSRRAPGDPAAEAAR